MYFWVLDLWPESLQAAGNINNRHILDFFSKIAALMYRNSERILIASQGFRDSILDKGDFIDKLVYFPNWAEDVFADAAQMPVPQMPEGFKVMFAGNVGEAQDFENVMKTAHLLRDTDVKIIIVGDGRKKPWADKFIDENHLRDVVYMMGRHPLELMPSFFKAADVMFLSLKDEYIFSLTIPAKLQAYMASGKPVAAMINGEARKLIQEADCGMSCPSGDPEAFADCIRSLRNMSSAKLEELGSNGKKYFDKYFQREKCMDVLCNLMEDCHG
jgi:glycosyltransferase involved in cell wall biosynthesis